MALSTTSNYAGKAAGFYISAALRQSNSMEFLTMIENIKFKSNIQRMAASAMVQDATCNFDEAGSLALTEQILTPKNLQINTDICKSTLLDSWEALQMRAGAGAPPPASFDDYVISYLGEIIADGTETSIWTGADGTAGQFEGFLTATTGAFAVDGNVVAVANVGGAGTAYTAVNIIANLGAAVAAVPTAVYAKEDLYLYVSPKSWRLYMTAISALTNFPFANMSEDYTKIFEGVKLAVCQGMADDEIVAAQKSNLFFGTDLVSDATRINMMDMANLDGSDNIRVVARYSGGVQVGVGADVVLVS